MKRAFYILQYAAFYTVHSIQQLLIYKKIALYAIAGSGTKALCFYGHQQQVLCQTKPLRKPQIIVRYFPGFLSQLEYFKALEFSFIQHWFNRSDYIFWDAHERLLYMRIAVLPRGAADVIAIKISYRYYIALLRTLLGTLLGTLLRTLLKTLLKTLLRSLRWSLRDFLLWSLPGAGWQFFRENFGWKCSCIFP